MSFSAEFLRSDGFRHALSKGEQREMPVRGFFEKNLPNTFGVVSGEVVDLNEVHSPQMDLMIFDKVRNFPFFSSEGTAILPAEALLVSIEVKSCLTATELEKSYRAAHKLRQLTFFGKPLAGLRKRGAPADEKCRVYYCVFAYESNLSSDNWLDRTYKRCHEAAEAAETEIWEVNRVYVAGYGLINTHNRCGLAEEPDQGIGLMTFYMHVLNFLARENSRRPSVPYLEYAGRLTQGWRKLKHPKNVDD